MKRRQKTRRAVILAMFASLPITLYYFSPVLSLQAASIGVIAGSVLVFLALFLSSIFLGRLFCGWACPAGGAQELVLLVRKRPSPRERIRWIKWLIWTPWFAMLLFLLLRANGVRSIDFLYQTRSGVSVSDLPGLIAYLSVVAVFAILALAVGRRAGCHVVCWMAPFMIVGRLVGRFLRLPALRLSANPLRCSSCGMCTRACPMSIDVRAAVAAQEMESTDCILCGVCVDGCPKAAIGYAFRPPLTAERETYTLKH